MIQIKLKMVAGCRDKTDNGISKIIGIMEFGTPIVIGPRTAGIEINTIISRYEIKRWWWY